MAEHFLGSLISLVSTSDIRYRGILRQIDHVNSTIQLEQVYSMGTEHRRPAHEYLPPNPKPYDYIVFRATEVKDLNVERHATDMQTAMLDNDPAIIGASSGVQPPPPPQAATAQAQAPAAPGPATSTTPAEPAPAPGPAAAAVVPAAAATEPAKANGQQQPQQPRNVANVRQQQTQRQVSRDGSIRSAEVAVESVERAMDQLRVSSGDEQQPQAAEPQQQPSTERRGGGGGGRRGGRRGGHHGPAIKGPGVVPDTPFDFSRSNAKFDKASLVMPEFTNAAAGGAAGESPEVGGAETPSTSEAGAPATGSTGAGTPGHFYDKKKSFFDDISSDSKARTEEASTGVRVGGAAVARQRREEERNRNLSTFGEAGIGGGQNHWRGGSGRGGPGGRGRGGRPRGSGRGGRGSAAAVSAQ